MKEARKALHPKSATMWLVIVLSALFSNVQHGAVRAENVIPRDEQRINVGMSGAWFDPELPGQGVVIQVLPERSEIFAAWFTFGEDDDAPAQDWLTAQGSYSELRAELELTRTTGGRFTGGDPVNSLPGDIGTLTLDFESCDRLVMRYRLFDSGDQRESRLIRIGGSQLCDAWSGAPSDLSTRYPFSKKRYGELYRMPVRFNVVRRADGTGGIDETLIDTFMDDLNHGFRDTPFFFVASPERRYLDDDAYYADFPTFASMVPMLNGNFERGVIDVYLVPSVRGGNFPASVWSGPPNTAGSRGLLMGYDHTGSPANTVTPPHEMGHLFYLYHPYETVWAVECVRRSNCQEAGDLVCDTPASPTVFGGNTLATGEYFGGATGPCSGDGPMQPDTHNYMEAGWLDGHITRNHFTRGQIDRMVWGLHRHQPDLIGPEAWDLRADCDGDGREDLDQVLDFAVADLNQDAVPDQCQRFLKAGEWILASFSGDQSTRLRAFDQAGTYAADLGNGSSWVDQMRLGPDGTLWLSHFGIITRYDLVTGRSPNHVYDGRPDNATSIRDFLFTASGDLLVLDGNTSRLLRIDPHTRAASVLANLGTAGLSQPTAMERDVDGRLLILGNSSTGDDAIVVFDEEARQVVGTRVPGGAGGLGDGQGLLIIDDRLLVSDASQHAVLEFDRSSGEFVRALVTEGDGALRNPQGLAVSEDGDLLVVSSGTDSVKRYALDSGRYLGDFIEARAGAGRERGTVLQPSVLFNVPADLAERYFTGVNVGHSGAWYAPKRPGQGFLVEILPESQEFFAAWFTYPEEGSGWQWFTAQGSISGKRLVGEVFETTGGRLGDPDAVTETRAVGELSIRFDSCDRARVRFDLPGTDRDGGLDLVRVGASHLCRQLDTTPR